MDRVEEESLVYEMLNILVRRETLHKTWGDVV